MKYESGKVMYVTRGLKGMIEGFMEGGFTMNKVRNPNPACCSDEVLCPKCAKLALAGLSDDEEPQFVANEESDDHLRLPVYNFGHEEPVADEEHLLQPVYNFAKER